MSDWNDGDGSSNQNHGGSRRSPPTNSRWEQDRRNDDYGKRRNDRDGGGGGGYRSRGYDHNETIELRSDCVGMIIGRGGSNIQRLQNDYNVRVDINKGSGTVTVSGNNEGDVRSALDSIKNQIERSDNRGSGGGYRGNNDSGGSYRDRENWQNNRSS